MAAEDTVSRLPSREHLARRPLVPSLAPAVMTTRGRRERNQDRVCALRTLVGGETAVLLAVADGIGGLAAGEQAADLALQVVSHYAHAMIPDTEPDPPPLRRCLDDLLRVAGRRIWLWALDNGLGNAGGTTLVVALVWGRHYLVAHAGDSRCYYVNARGASPLTVDHTEAARLVRLGELDPEKAHVSPLRHRLTNALGGPADLAVDLAPVAEDLGVLDEDCALVVCSDGLHAVVDGEDMHHVLHETRSVEDACRRLVALALERGSADNVSVAAVEVGRLKRHAPPA